MGFTAISSTYSAQDLVAILNELFARFDRLAEVKICKYLEMGVFNQSARVTVHSLENICRNINSFELKSLVTATTALVEHQWSDLTTLSFAYIWDYQW